MRAGLADYLSLGCTTTSKQWQLTIVNYSFMIGVDDSVFW